jgi:hypothetical protein
MWEVSFTDKHMFFHITLHVLVLSALFACLGREIKFGVGVAWALSCLFD